MCSDKSYRPEHKKKLIEDIEQKLKQPSEFTKNINNDEPSLEYERLRRRVYSNTQEMWNFVQHEVLDIQKLVNSVDSKGVVQKKFENMLEMTAEHKRSLLNDINQMREVDGYENWRQKESAALSDLVQKRLTVLQHPEDCATAQKLLCRLNKVRYNNC